MISRTALLYLLPALACAEDILLVSNNNTNSQALFDFLVAEGHNVARDARGDGPLANDSSDFDLVVVARATNSGDYANNAAEVTAWNTLPIPIICCNAYLYRNNRWKWMTGDTLATATTAGIDSPYLIPGHAFVQGLTAPETVIFDPPPPTATGSLAELVAGAVVISTRDGGTNQGLFVLPSGSVLNDGITISAPRIGYTIGHSNQFAAINENGKQILRNIIADVGTPADQDLDGMTDSYELANTDPPSPIDLVPGEDDDADGLTNLQEFLGQDSSGTSHGFGQTRASLEDTDADGIDDNDEITGSLNGNFANAPSDPTATDTDEDGLGDGDEILGTLNTANAGQPTNPADEDSDGDLMDDGYEIANNTNGGLDPNTNDADGNLDGDAGPLTNLDEYQGTTLGVQTRADLLDTDDDGYEDVVETNTGIWASLTATGTNPVVADTDGDTLLDGQENPDLADFPGLGVLPTNSDPNLLHSDADGLTDQREVNDYGTNPSNLDSDNDTFADDAEFFAYQTDPTDENSVPTSAQIDGLHINFTSGTGQVNGFQDYVATHEQIATFTPQSFPAFGTNVTIAPSWNDDGGSVHPEAPQMIRRGVNLDRTEAPFLVRDFIGTDNRRIPGNPMTITLSNLPAGTYQWTSYHHDPDNQTGIFDVTVTHAGGTEQITGVEITDTRLSGITEWEEYGTFSQTFVSDGSDVTLEFSSDSQDGVNPIEELFFLMSGFSLITTAPAQAPTITDISFTDSGNLQFTILPASPGYILTESADLVSPFTEVTNANFDGTDTFTIPAAFISREKSFFRIERP